MKNFARAARLALKHPVNLLGILFCSLCVALLWGGNVGTVYPFVEVVLRGESPHQWCEAKIALAKSQSRQLQAEILRLQEEQRRAVTQQGRERAAREIAFRHGRLDAEQRALAAYRWLKPRIEKYLPDDPFQTLGLVIAFLFIGTLLKDGFLVGNVILCARLVQSTALELRNRFYGHILHMDLPELERNRTGGLMSRFTTDLTSVSGGIGTLFGETTREPLKMVVCLIGAALISWRLLIFSLIVCPMAVLLLNALAKSIKRANRRNLEETAVLYRRLSETLSGMRALRAFTMEPSERRRFRQTTRQLYRRAMKVAKYVSLTKPINELLGIAVISLALLAGGYLVLNQETRLFGITMTDRPLSFGAMMAFFAFLGGVSDPARKLSGVFNRLQAAAAAADRIYELMDRKPAIADPPSPGGLPDGGGDLVFDHVWFSYTPDRPVLQDVHLRVPFGETVAVVGPNGCGKSTLVNLILRFYDPAAGAVRLGGIDLRQVRLRDLRGRIGVVSQQTFLFDDTIANNIRYGSPDATDEQVIEAAKRARAHQFIQEELEHGYDTNVGERACRLSGGQRQRVALARAILRDPQILILDEATSQIDPESEVLIRQALEQFMAGRTAIIITHCMSTLVLAQRILVMDAGRVVDFGTHEQLLARCELYRRLYQTDFRKSA